MRFCKETVKKELLNKADLQFRNMKESRIERSNYEIGSYKYRNCDEDFIRYMSMGQALLLCAMNLGLISESEYYDIMNEECCF